MSDSALAKPNSAALAPRKNGAETTQSVKAELNAAREKLARDLETLENKLEGIPDWRARLKKNPIAAVGGALLVGYVVGRWLFGR